MSIEIDVFPSYAQSSSRMTKLSLPNEIMTLNSVPFISTLRGVSLAFLSYSKGSKNYQKALRHIDYVLDEADNFDLPVINVQWKKTNKRLERFPHCKKNMDVTLAYRMENIYLTKRYFTFGLRRTGSGECHVYQTHKTPLLFYLPKTSSISSPDKTFQCFDRPEYNCYILEPESAYLVRENVAYLIITTGKSLFAVDILSMSDVDPSNFKDPAGNLSYSLQNRCLRVRVEMW